MGRRGRGDKEREREGAMAQDARYSKREEVKGFEVNG